jgi:hypothetical protein
MTNTLSEWNRNDRKAVGPGLNRTGHIGTQPETQHSGGYQLRLSIHTLYRNTHSMASPFFSGFAADALAAIGHEIAVEQSKPIVVMSRAGTPFPRVDYAVTAGASIPLSSPT